MAHKKPHSAPVSIVTRRHQNLPVWGIVHRLSGPHTSTLNNSQDHGPLQVHISRLSVSVCVFLCLSVPVCVRLRVSAYVFLLPGGALVASCRSRSAEASTFSTRESVKDTPSNHVHNGRAGCHVRVRHSARTQVVADNGSAKFRKVAQILQRATDISIDMMYD